jgi:DNA-binding MarR family transcriptional regulator
MNENLASCVRELMDTTPQIVQAIRVEMRLGRGSNLTIPQFRTLRFIQSNADPSLSDLAEFLGLTLPSVSKLVDGLVKQELVIRHDSARDRRCLELEITPTGKKIVNSARTSAQVNLAKKLSGLSEKELRSVQQAMELLHPLFAQQTKP